MVWGPPSSTWCDYIVVGLTLFIKLYVYIFRLFLYVIIYNKKVKEKFEDSFGTNKGNILLIFQTYFLFIIYRYLE